MAEQTTVPVKAGDGGLRRWAPSEILDTIRDEIDRLWGQSGFGPHPRSLLRPTQALMAWAPRMDVFEKEGSLVVKADLPGVKKEDVQVTLERGDLLIQGERKTESEVKEEDYYRCERSYGGFYRRLPLPAEVKADQIQASFTDGVLEVRVRMPVVEQPELAKIKVT